MASAEWLSNDMASGDYFGHTDSLGREPYQRMGDFGNASSRRGENLAGGPASGQGAFDVWKFSPGHNDNMLRPGFRVIGIARVYNAASKYGWYWTTDYGGLPPKPTPAPALPSELPRTGTG